MKSLFFKSFLFTLLVPGTVAVAVPLQIIKGSMIYVGWQFIFGTLLLLSGFIIYSGCVWRFVTSGLGTPAPVDPPKQLVVRGIYGYSRNPMYLAVLSIILGWTLLYASFSLLVYWACLVICFQLLILFYEEPELEKQFSFEYIAYKLNVNRWLPKI